MATKTPNRGYCIGTCSEHKHFMTRLDSPNRVEILRIDVPNFEFFATEIDVLNKVELQERKFNFKPGTTLYLVASREMIGWYYIMMATPQGMGCSCKHDNCEHQGTLREHQTTQVAAKPEPLQPVEIEVVAEQVESTPRTREYWLEIVRKGKERDRAFLDGYWKEVKALQLEAQQSGSQQVF
ncbi:MAG TPA: hypothetical protein VHV10_04000 [Ktedonobacteraceae bacterium]|jgi:hypothetical protein|nr:hypothetical protein [Ktedonobacteraceae bacterium]